jgi:hypothetical protein
MADTKAEASPFAPAEAVAPPAAEFFTIKQLKEWATDGSKTL